MADDMPHQLWTHTSLRDMSVINSINSVPFLTPEKHSPFFQSDGKVPELKISVRIEAISEDVSISKQEGSMSDTLAISSLTFDKSLAKYSVLNVEIFARISSQLALENGWVLPRTCFVYLGDRVQSSQQLLPCGQNTQGWCWHS